MSSPVTLRSIALPAYLPAMLYGIGQGAIAPVVALTARDRGASIPTAGLVVALLGVGQVLGDVPAGAIASRLGERRAMLLASGLVSVALVACVAARDLLTLSISVTAIGMTNSVFNLARQAYLTEIVPLHLRARALSALGGTLRIGMFVGPFLAAPFVALWGIRAAYGVHLVMAGTVVVALLVVREPEHLARPARDPDPVAVRRIVRDHARVLLTLGTSGVLIGAVRASRQVVIPLWAERIGLDPAAISVVYGLSAVLDMLLFYPAGKIMDVRGRAAVAVPSMAVLGVAHLLLPLTHGVLPLVGVALLLGVGNGMGSGVVMTLGADVSPVRGRAQFLGVWRLFHDSGVAAGPLVLSATVTAAGLAAGVAGMGVVGLLAAGLLARWIPSGIRHGARMATDADAVGAADVGGSRQN